MITLQDIRASYRNYTEFSCQIDFVRRFYRNPVREERKWGKLRFERPQTLEMEWADDVPNREGKIHRILWKEGKAIRYRPSEDAWQEEESIEVALGAEAGISGGLTYVIPSLLLCLDDFLQMESIHSPSEKNL